MPGRIGVLHQSRIRLEIIHRDGWTYCDDEDTKAVRVVTKMNLKEKIGR